MTFIRLLPSEGWEKVPKGDEGRRKQAKSANV